MKEDRQRGARAAQHQDEQCRGLRRRSVVSHLRRKREGTLQNQQGACRTMSTHSRSARREQWGKRSTPSGPWSKRQGVDFVAWQKPTLGCNKRIANRPIAV